jgi:predicted GH43/DUF377 family glycosyl hydrolase
MFIRSPHNPILTGADMPEAQSIFNPGATLLRDGRTALLLRVEDHRGLSSLYVARSADGATNWTIDAEPLLVPDAVQPMWEWGFEDARVVYLAETDRYAITCTAYGSSGPSVYLAMSKDLTSVEDGCVVMPPEDKNAALFPHRINGQWLLLHRPVSGSTGSADIWLSRSDDLVSWRSPEQLMITRASGWWDSSRIGIGPPPLETAEGWIQIYHGVRNTTAGAIYRVGAVLLDLEQPWIVRRRLSHWILGPTEPYERVGDVGNVVFPCGAIQRTDTGMIDLYYGGADTVVCLASISEAHLLAELLADKMLLTS